METQTTPDKYEIISYKSIGLKGALRYLLIAGIICLLIGVVGYFTVPTKVPEYKGTITNEVTFEVSENSDKTVLIWLEAYFEYRGSGFVQIIGTNPLPYNISVLNENEEVMYNEKGEFAVPLTVPPEQQHGSYISVEEVHRLSITPGKYKLLFDCERGVEYKIEQKPKYFLLGIAMAFLTVTGIILMVGWVYVTNSIIKMKMKQQMESLYSDKEKDMYAKDYESRSR